MPNNQPDSLPTQDINQPLSQAQENSLSKPPKPGGLNILLLLIIFFLLGSTGLFAYQNSQLREQLSKTPPVLESSSLVKETDSTQAPGDQLDTDSDLIAESKQVAEPSDPCPTCPPATAQFPHQLPLVVYEPPLASDEYQLQRAELQRKIVDPLVDYHQHIYGMNDLMTVMVSLETFSPHKDEFPYYVTALSFVGGQSYTSLSQTDGVVDWWVPVCLDSCNFSPEFREKYPEIVRLAE